MDETETQNQDRVRKRTSNACTRCRKQKIRCSGTIPCSQCSRRSIDCIFDDKQHKVIVSQSYLARLEQHARDNAAGGRLIHGFHQTSKVIEPAHQSDTPPQSASQEDVDVDVDVDQASEFEDSQQDDLRATPDPGLTNPLNPDSSDSFTVNNASRRYFLGVSSNWSFGRRVSKLVHERINGVPLPGDSLLFEGSTYDLGWDGLRSPSAVDTSSLPTADFALFLINAVKFHCGHLFHMFDETIFMKSFSKFYDSDHDQYPKLWYIHFLLILAFGKAFIVRASKGKRPPGADLFIQAMQLLPDITYLHGDPIQSIEILCCAALYLQCLDLRSAAYNLIGQALRMAIEQGMHTDMQGRQLSSCVTERCRKVWWTTYVLDRQMTSLMGVPMSLSDDDITAPLPSFTGSTTKSLAHGLFVKLAKANAVILQTVYGKSGGNSERFLASIKNALSTLAEANDERNESFPLHLRKPSGGICRLSAYLHLFHHQALILATRPLLYSFLQKRLDSSRQLRVSSSHGARSLIRVCVSSAQQCLNILEALQAQSLLESFVPFDREAAFSSALVLVIAAAVDTSLIQDKQSRIEVAHMILEEMALRGSLLAEFHKRELEQLETNLRILEAMTDVDAATTSRGHQRIPSNETSSYQFDLPDQQTGSGDNSHFQSAIDNIDTMLSEWNSEDGLSGEHLQAMADSLDFGSLNWLMPQGLE